MLKCPCVTDDSLPYSLPRKDHNSCNDALNANSSKKKRSFG